MLWLDMSLGKTAITLTTIADLIDQCQCWGALVLAPRRVAETVWAQEAKLWTHLRWLNISVLRGRKKTLLARDLFREQAHVYVANYEMIPWLVVQMNELFLGRGQHLPLGGAVGDAVDDGRSPVEVAVSLPGVELVQRHLVGALGEMDHQYFSK